MVKGEYTANENNSKEMLRVYDNKKFTRDDTNVIKGVAILSIILHNLLHWISPSPGENEFDFYRDRVNNLLME